MNDIIKDKILNLFKSINLDKNKKTLKLYGELSHLSYVIIVLGFSAFEACVNYYLLQSHFMLSFLMFANMNLFFLLLYREKIKANDILQVTKNKIFSFFKITSGIQDSVSYVEAKIYESLLNIENQYLYLSLFDSILTSVNSNNQNSIKNKNLNYKIEEIQNLFEKNQLPEAANRIASLLSYIYQFKNLDLEKVLIAPKYSDYELQMLAIATKYSKEYIDQSENKKIIDLTKPNKHNDTEEEIELNGNNKINWRKIID